MTAGRGGKPPRAQVPRGQVPAAGQPQPGQPQPGQPQPGQQQPGQAPRPRLTGRAAILAIVLAAVALSLAYPVREYVAQRRQIDLLRAQGQRIAAQLRQLQQQRRELGRPAYIERLARDELHMCLPTQMCYVIIPAEPSGARPGTRRPGSTPWYARLWSSVQQADIAQPATTGRHPARSRSPRPHAAGRRPASSPGGPAAVRS